MLLQIFASCVVQGLDLWSNWVKYALFEVPHSSGQHFSFCFFGAIKLWIALKKRSGMKLWYIESMLFLPCRIVWSTTGGSNLGLSSCAYIPHLSLNFVQLWRSPITEGHASDSHAPFAHASNGHADISRHMRPIFEMDINECSLKSTFVQKWMSLTPDNTLTWRMVIFK